MTDASLSLYLVTGVVPPNRIRTPATQEQEEGHTMAERNLRGMRLGSQSLQSEEGVEFVSRRKSLYRTEDGSTFEVTFAFDAEIPETWESPRSGQEGRLVAEDGSLVETEVVETKAPRTHWDMLLERRSRAELEELLQERLALLRARRGEEASKNSKKSA
jgi:hypothetical protein